MTATKLLQLGMGIALGAACHHPAQAKVNAAAAARLAAVLAAQPQQQQARYAARQPQQTLEFLGIRPGMTVVEVLPGGGWYSAILVPYLGSEGMLIGADYPLDMWPNFPFASEQFMTRRRAWPEQWPQEAAAWAGADGASVVAVRLGAVADTLNGRADAVLFIRALHNLSRFEHRGGYRSQALAEAWALLKPGGAVGVVQHEAPAARSAAWATGAHGYLNRAALIGQFEAIGFEFVAASDINRNPRDVPAADDSVWRLPPSLRGSDDPQLRARYEAIGESNRMTLLFRKP